VELWDLTTSRRLHCIRRPNRDRHGGLYALLGPGGRSLWIGGETDEGTFCYDLGTSDPPMQAPQDLRAVAPAGKLFLHHVAAGDHRATPALAVRRGEETNLEITTEQAMDTLFSPDGRYLAWGSSGDGTLALADVQALEREAAQFMKAISSE
jgi:hypothetical protein